MCPLAALAVGGCASVATRTPTLRPATMPAPTPTTTPVPDTRRVDVVGSGLGSYQLITVPVAVLHNVAARTGVSGVIVHFVPTRRGHPLTPVDSPTITLYPGETLAVTANCTDTCLNADAVTVTVGPGSWSLLPGAPLTAGPAAAVCANSCSGHGQWDVTAAVGSPELSQGMRVDLFAWCLNGTGTIIGGGQREVLWPQQGGSLSLDVPAILNTPPASCTVGASTPI